MAKIEQCLIDVQLALAIKTMVEATGVAIPDGKLGLMCPECKRAVKPHAGESAHFEHLRRNSNCSLSHKMPAYER
jgi:hypothetical protein